MKKNILLFILLAIHTSSFAREGIWFPQLLASLNETEMRSMGMQISAEDIYSLNQSSLKDAVLQFGGGCTGELISARGLLVTNHHCGFSQIQSLSTIEKNYLKDGYWAKTDADEIPCPGLTVTFVREIVDVTNIVLQGLSSTATESDRTALVKLRSDSLEKVFSDGKGQKSFVRSFFAGNEYYLFKTEVFKDIRFVGAPPQTIGNFGGETDNWVWPRHTGDFSMFRIYANKENQSADYSKDNVPYVPKRFLEICASGVNENDFAMVYGFPGRTNEYITSPALDVYMNQTDPNRISIREKRLEVWKKAMNENDTIALKYASKIKSLANYYKKWSGEVLALRRFNALDVKKKYEAELNVSSDGKMKSIIDSIQYYNDLLRPLSFNNDYLTESLQGIELLGMASKFLSLEKLCSADTTSDAVIHTEIERLKGEFKGAWKNYSAPTDKIMAASMFKLAGNKLDPAYRPSLISSITSEEELTTKTNLYFSSFIKDSTQVVNYLSSFKKKSIKKLRKDPAFVFAKEFAGISKKLSAPMSEINGKLAILQRNYLALIRATDKKRMFYPDANSTLRCAYGKIQSVQPADGKVYKFMTTTDGILEKANTLNPDYKVPEKLAQLIKSKDYGTYAVNGSVPVCFLASVHTTGGNSGSPVLNAKGQLIGINFDGLWEGIMTDVAYDENYSRNISVDVRYFLFVVEKFGEASRLINEMKIVK